MRAALFAKSLMRRVSSSWALLILSVLLIAGGSYEAFDSHYVVNWDAVASWLLAFRWMGVCLSNGSFGDYFPYIFSGYTLAGNIELGFYNPLYNVFALLFYNSTLSINLTYLSTQILLFVVTYLIGRQFKLTSFASVYFGLSMVASGFFIGHAEHFSYLATALGMQACFLGMLWARSGLLFRGFAAIFLGTLHAGTAGYPMNMAVGSIFLGAVFIVDLCIVQRERRIGYLLITVLAGAAGFVLSLPALLHFMNSAMLSPRAEGVTIAEVLRGSLPLYSLERFFTPWWHWTDYTIDLSMDRFHLLISTPYILLFGLFSSRIRNMLKKEFAIILSLIAVLLLYSLGKYSPVPFREALAQHLELFRMGRFTCSELSYQALFLVGLLSAFILSRLQEGLKRDWLVSTVVILFLGLDFLCVMRATRDIRMGEWERGEGELPILQTHFGKEHQDILDRPRICPEGKKKQIDQRILFPNNFSWWGYSPLLPKKYYDERDDVEWALCGESRLLSVKTRKPLLYSLRVYAPGRVRFTMSIKDMELPARLVWAEVNDGFWRLYVNGKERPLLSGPALLRYFEVSKDDGPDVHIEMIYHGPLSRLWRHPKKWWLDEG